LCPFESRVIGVGPQIGFIFPVAGMQGYLNLKAYKEFDNANRPDGWNAWGDACVVTCAICCRVFTASDPNQASITQLKWERSEDAMRSVTFAAKVGECCCSATRYANG
jgi:hypothetical protein